MSFVVTDYPYLLASDIIFLLYRIFPLLILNRHIRWSVFSVGLVINDKQGIAWLRNKPRPYNVIKISNNETEHSAKANAS